MRGRTSEPELEKANFAKADEALAEVRSATVIDGQTVAASYVQDDGIMTAQWVDNSVVSMASRVHGMMPTSSVQQH